MAVESIAKGDRKVAIQSPEIELEGFLLSLHRLSNVLGDSSILEIHSVGLSEWAILSALESGQGVNLQDLVRQSGVSRQRISKILQELRTKKLITLNPFQDGDKRQRIVIATKKGLQVRQAILSSLRELLKNEIDSAFPSNEKSKLGSWFAFTSRLSNRVARALRQRNKLSDKIMDPLGTKTE